MLKIIALAVLMSVSASTAHAMLSLKAARLEVTSPELRLSDLFNGVQQDKVVALAPAPGKQITYDRATLAAIIKRYNSTADTLPLDASLVISRAALPEVEPLPMIEPVALTNFNSLEPVANVPTVSRVEAIAPAAIVDEVSIPVLNQMIGSKALITADDIVWKQLDAKRVGADMVLDASDLIGMTARRNIPAGQPIRRGDVQAPKLVNKGELVLVSLTSSRLQLSVQGKALQNGAKGEVVQVLNPKSNRVIEGTVSGPNQVTVPAVEG